MTLLELPTPTPKEVTAFRRLMLEHFSVTLSDAEAQHFATKALRLAYVLSPSLLPVRAQEHGRRRPPNQVP